MTEVVLKISGEYQLSIWGEKTKPLHLYLTRYTKIDSRQIKDTNVKTQLEENPGDYLK